MKKAEKLGITFEEGHVPTEDKLDQMIEQKQDFIVQQKKETVIQRAAEKKAEDESRKNKVILKDVDGDDVDQADYFMPRVEEEKITDVLGKVVKTIPVSDQTAPLAFNKMCGMPVDRDELIEVFLQYFPRKKGFLFYKLRDKEVYLIIVPLKYSKQTNYANGSLPGDFQRHALSFISEGSVNVESLKLKLQRIAGHQSSISTEPIDR